MKKIHWLSIAAALVTLAGCQTAEPAIQKNIGDEQPSHSEAEIKPTPEEYKGKAEEAVQLYLESLEKEDATLYQSTVTNIYGQQTIDQTEAMFKEYDLGYEFGPISIESADEKQAVATVQYKTFLKTGSPDSFSDNDSSFRYVLTKEGGSYKVNSIEVVSFVELKGEEPE